MEKVNDFCIRKKRCGFTLIETMITLAVIGAALAVVLVYQRKAESSSRVLETVSAMANMTSKIRAYYAFVGSYSGLDGARVKAMGLVAQPFTWNGFMLQDAWGNVMIVSGNAVGAAPTFVITFGGVVNLIARPLTAEECVSLATKLANGADRVMVGAIGTIGVANGLASGGKVYKAAGNILSMDNLTDAAGCGAANPMVALQYH
jgi:prepilin-type N-terminal cleavage/methylation domain-containing protein